MDKKVEYIMTYGPCKTTHDVKVQFNMPVFSRRKTITHCFHVDNARCDAWIGYIFVIVCDLMVQLGLKAEFGRLLLEWENTSIPMKEPGNLLGQLDLTKRKMQEVVINTAEPDSTREANAMVVKYLTVPMQSLTLITTLRLNLSYIKRNSNFIKSSNRI